MSLFVTIAQQMNISLNVENIDMLSISVDTKLFLFEATKEVLQEILVDLEMDHHEALEIPQDGEIEVSLHLLDEVSEVEEPLGENGEVLEATGEVIVDTALIINDQLVTMDIARLNRESIVIIFAERTSALESTSGLMGLIS